MTEKTESAKSFYQSQNFVYAELIIVVIIIAGRLMGIVPYSATPFLFLFGWLSLRLRNSGWKEIGLKKPARSKLIRLALLGLIIGFAYQIIDTFIIEPVLSSILKEQADLSQFDNVPSNPLLAGVILIGIWTFAAFGEEMSYRAYMMDLIARIFGKTKSSWIAALIISSLIFGLMHAYQGINGIIGTGITGLIFGLAYLFTNKNLWLSIFLHGFLDTVGLVFLYMGWFV